MRFESAVEGRGRTVVTLLGEPGVGKSRLVRAFVAELSREEARVATGRCLAYGEGITYWPLREVMDELFGELTLEVLNGVLGRSQEADAVARRLAAAVGLTDEAYPVEEIRWAARRLVETLAQDRPLILVLEDIHWAEAMFLDLARHVARAGEDVPVFLLCVARPDLLERNPDWMEHIDHASRVWLHGLQAADAEELVVRLDPGTLSKERRKRVVEAAEGNPLFLEQLTAFALEDVEDGESLNLPPSLRALLAARLDRLGPGERAVLECAAVVGREFSVSAVCELLPADARRTARRHIDSLTSKGLLEEAALTLPFETGLRFRHVLLQEATYRSVSKGRRAQLHERLALWLAHRAQPGANELVGYHLEQSYWHLVEVGKRDQLTKNIGRQAADALYEGGQRAFARGDFQAAVNLYSRSVSTVENEDPARLRPLLGLGMALYGIVELSSADEVLSEAVESARSLGDKDVEWRARLELSDLRILNAPRGAADAALKTAAKAIGVFEDNQNEAGLSRAWRLVANAHHVQWSLPDVEHAAERALLHARLAQDVVEESLSISWLAQAMVDGVTPVAQVIDRLTTFLGWAREKENRGLEEHLLSELGEMHAERGDFAHARSTEHRRRTILSELGQERNLGVVEWIAGRIELLAGNADEAERRLRRAYEALESTGNKGHLSTLALNLAEALYRQGRNDEIDALICRSEELGSPDDGVNQILGRRLRAKLLACQGKLDDAETLVNEAVRLARVAGSPLFLGDALMDQGDVLLQRPDGPASARAAIESAVAEYERKGALISARRAKSLLKTISTQAD